MDTKEYIVALEEGIDYDKFWSDMESNTIGLQHIPDRVINITNNRTAFKRICEYALTDDEADLIRNDPRVVGIEIPVRNNPNVSIHNDAVIQDKNFSKIIAPTGNEVNWGLIRHSYSNNNYGNAAETFKTTNKKYNYTLDGTGVDVVICDSGLQIDHPEFVGRVLDVNWDQYTPGGITGLNTNSRIDTSGHGTHVAGIAAGTTYGWAKGANVIPLKSFTGDFDGNGEPLDIFETLINWHQSKNGSRPTVVNMSWELRFDWNSTALGDYRTYVTGGSWRGNPILAGMPAEPVPTNSSKKYYPYYEKIGLIDLLQGLPLQDAGTPLYLPYTSMAYNAALAEVIDAGIVVVQAAGNNNFKMDKPDGTGDYDNYFNIVVPALSWNGRVYYHRGSSPRDPRAIVVGNLFYGFSPTGKEYKSSSSTKGPRIDVWAAGSYIMSSVSSNTGQPYQHGDTTFKQDLKSGTSMSSPQVAGMCALYLQKYPTATPAEVKAWIKNTSIKGLYDTSPGSSTAYSDYNSLLGSDTGIAYQNLESLSKSHIKDDVGTWKEAKAVFVKHKDGTWHQVQIAYIKTESGWQKTYQM